MDKLVFDYFWQGYKENKSVLTRLDSPEVKTQGQPLPRVQGVHTSIPLGIRYFTGCLGEDGIYYIKWTEASQFHTEEEMSEYFSLLWRWKDDLYMIRVPKVFSHDVMLCLTVETFLSILFWFHEEKDCPENIASFVEDLKKIGSRIPKIQEIIDQKRIL